MAVVVRLHASALVAASSGLRRPRPQRSSRHLPWPRGEARACKARTRPRESARCLWRPLPAAAPRVVRWPGLPRSRPGSHASLALAPPPSGALTGLLHSSVQLPRARGAEGRHDRAVRVPALASRDHRAVVEGGELLRPALVARRGVVSRPLSAPPTRAGWSARRARATSSTRSPPSGLERGPGREADRSPPRPRRARVLAVPARGRARPRAALVRGRAGGGGGSHARRGRAPARRSARVQPRVVGPHVRRARALRRAARAVARRVPARAAARRHDRRAGGADVRDVRRRPRLPRRARRTSSTSTHASSTATTRRCGPRPVRRSQRASRSRTGGSRRSSADRSGWRQCRSRR